MQQMVSIREANQQLSRYIDLLLEGQEIIITRRGHPVAKLMPYTDGKDLDLKKDAARQRTLARMKKGYHLGGRCLTRDGLHER